MRFLYFAPVLRPGPVYFRSSKRISIEFPGPVPLYSFTRAYWEGQIHVLELHADRNNSCVAKVWKKVSCDEYRQEPPHRKASICLTAANSVVKLTTWIFKVYNAASKDDIIPDPEGQENDLFIDQKANSPLIFHLLQKDTHFPKIWIRSLIHELRKKTQIIMRMFNRMDSLNKSLSGEKIHSKNTCIVRLAEGDSNCRVLSEHHTCISESHMAQLPSHWMHDPETINFRIHLFTEQGALETIAAIGVSEACKILTHQFFRWNSEVSTLAICCMAIVLPVDITTLLFSSLIAEIPKGEDGDQHDAAHHRIVPLQFSSASKSPLDLSSVMTKIQRIHERTKNYLLGASVSFRELELMQYGGIGRVPHIYASNKVDHLVYRKGCLRLPTNMIDTLLLPHLFLSLTTNGEIEFIGRSGKHLLRINKLKSGEEDSKDCSDEVQINEIISATRVIVVRDLRKMLSSCSALLHSTPFIAFLSRGGYFWCSTMADKLSQINMRCFTDMQLQYRQEEKNDDIVSHLTPWNCDMQHQYLQDFAVFLSTKSQNELNAFSLLQFHSEYSLALQDRRSFSQKIGNFGQTLSEIGSELQLFRNLLRTYIPSSVPLEMHQQWRWDDMKHLEALYFGGTIQFGEAGQESADPFDAGHSPYVYAVTELAYTAQVVPSLPLSILASYSELRGVSRDTKTAQSSRISSFIAKRGLLNRYRIITYDIESTGLNIQRDRIVEFAMYDALNRRSFSTLINPETRIPPKVIAIHGLSNEDVGHAPTWRDAAPRILEFLTPDRSTKEEVLLIAHNSRKLDERILLRQLQEEKLTLPSGVHFVDSIPLLRFSRDKSPETGLSSFRLSNMLQELAISIEGDLHRALSDATALWEIFIRLSMSSTVTPTNRLRSDPLVSGGSGERNAVDKTVDSKTASDTTVEGSQEKQLDVTILHTSEGLPTALGERMPKESCKSSEADEHERVLQWIGRSLEYPAYFCFSRTAILQNEVETGVKAIVNLPGEISPEHRIVLSGRTNSEITEKFGTIAISEFYNRWIACKHNQLFTMEPDLLKELCTTYNCSSAELVEQVQRLSPALKTLRLIQSAHDAVGEKNTKGVHTDGNAEVSLDFEITNYVPYDLQTYAAEYIPEQWTVQWRKLFTSLPGHQLVTLTTSVSASEIFKSLNYDWRELDKVFNNAIDDTMIYSETRKQGRCLLNLCVCLVWRNLYTNLKKDESTSHQSDLPHASATMESQSCGTDKMPCLHHVTSKEMAWNVPFSSVKEFTDGVLPRSVGGILPHDSYEVHLD